MKICKICGKNELEVEFYKGNSSVCKECVKERVYQNHLKREAEKAKLEGKEFHPRGHQLKCPTELVGKGYKYCNECKQWLPLSEFGYYYKKGYIKRNIQVISKLANSMKNSANKQQLKTFSEYYISNEK